MSEDITKRLRAAVPKMPYNGTPIAWPCTVRSELLLEAAAEIERLREEDTKTRHALKRWVFVCPDGGDEPTHERVAAVVAEVEKLRSEIERMRDVLRRVVVYPSGDRAARVAFVSVGCQVSFPLHPQTTWALEVLIEFDQARRNALEGKP